MKPNVFSIYSDELRFVNPFMPKKGEEVTFTIKAYSEDFPYCKLVLYEEHCERNGHRKNKSTEKHVIDMTLDIERKNNI